MPTAVFFLHPNFENSVVRRGFAPTRHCIFLEQNGVTLVRKARHLLFSTVDSRKHGFQQLLSAVLPSPRKARLRMSRDKSQRSLLCRPLCVYQLCLHALKIVVLLLSRIQVCGRDRDTIIPSNCKIISFMVDVVFILYL